MADNDGKPLKKRQPFGSYIVPHSQVNRGDDPYSNEVKAEAVALVYGSGNFSEAARTMAKRYPERHPSRQLITRWFNQVDPEAFASGLSGTTAEIGGNGRKVIPRSEYEYPQEVRAEAVALALIHRSYADAAREMAKRYPERHPERYLIRIWTKQQEPDDFHLLTQERNEQLNERSRDLAALTGDKLEEEVQAGQITGKTLAITWGISMDKVHKANELQQRSRESAANQALAEAIDRMANLTVPELNAIIEGDIIEGEARDVTDDDPGETGTSP